MGKKIIFIDVIEEEKDIVMNHDGSVWILRFGLC